MCTGVGHHSISLTSISIADLSAAARLEQTTRIFRVNHQRQARPRKNRKGFSQISLAHVLEFSNARWSQEAFKGANAGVSQGLYIMSVARHHSADEFNVHDAVRARRCTLRFKSS